MRQESGSPESLIQPISSLVFGSFRAGTEPVWSVPLLAISLIARRRAVLRTVLGRFFR